MANAVETSIIVPVYNEAANLKKLLGKIRALGLTDSEIIVVDDGSSDGSADIAMAAAALPSLEPSSTTMISHFGNSSP